MNRVKERGETIHSGADGPLSRCDEFLPPIHHTSQRHPSWGGAQEESRLIKKYADQWCRDNGYPIRKRKRTRYAQRSGTNNHFRSNFILP